MHSSGHRLTRLALDSCIFTVSAVLSTQWVGTTGDEQCLVANALHVVQPDPSASRHYAVGRSEAESHSVGETQLSAHHPGVQVSPAIVAHRAPRVLDADLHTALPVIGAIS